MVQVGTVVHTHFAETLCHYPCICLGSIHSIVNMLLANFAYVQSVAKYPLLLVCLYLTHK